MAEKEKSAVLANRIYWLDNLRTFMIFLVVLLHAGIVYETSGAGAWFWLVDDPSTNNLAGILNLALDIFVMSAIFFISGYFASFSLEKKGGWSFIKSKFIRLIIPWIFAVLTLMPLYKFIFLYSRSIPQESWTTYFHWKNGIFSQNWLWFLPSLFLFDLLYLFFTRAKISISNISLQRAIGISFLFGLIFLVCIDIFHGEGWTKTIFLDFQNERLLIYFMVFLLGSLCKKLNTFESMGKNKKLYIVLCSIVWIPVYFNVSMLSDSMKHPGKYLVSDTVDALLIRFSFLLSLLCVFYVLISTFRFYFNKQGKIGKELNKNSYGVYIIHTIVLGGIALTMLYTPLPSLLKYLLLTVSTFAVSNLIVYFYRKVIKPILFVKKMEETA